MSRHLDPPGLRRESLAEKHCGAAAGGAGDVEPVHQPAASNYTQAHSRRGHVLAGKYGVEVGYAGAAIGHLYPQELRAGSKADGEIELAAAGILVGVARDFRDGRGDARLVLVAEPQQRGDLARALPGGHHVPFAVNVYRQDGSQIDGQPAGVLIRRLEVWPRRRSRRRGHASRPGRERPQSPRDGCAADPG